MLLNRLTTESLQINGEAMGSKTHRATFIA
jgi:hypothetical protein